MLRIANPIVVYRIAVPFMLLLAERIPQRGVHIPECAAEQRGYRRDAYATSE